MDKALQSPSLPRPTQYDTLSIMVVNSYNLFSAVSQGQASLRQEIVSVLSGQLNSAISPDIALELFGSSVTGLALVDSDVNINLSIPSPDTNLVCVSGHRYVFNVHLHVFSSNVVLYMCVHYSVYITRIYSYLQSRIASLFIKILDLLRSQSK